MKGYKIYPGSRENNPYIEKDLEAAIIGIREWLESGDYGDTVTIKIIEVSDRGWDLVPEWQGP